MVISWFALVPGTADGFQDVRLMLRDLSHAVPAMKEKSALE